MKTIACFLLTACVAVAAGYTILVWTEGTGWNKGGSLAWQLFDPSGDALPEHTGRVDDVPVWSFAGVFAGLDGNFTIVY